MRSLRLVALLAIPAQVAFSQQPGRQGAPLPLEEAISVARKNNPLFLQTENSLRIQDAQVRQAYGALLPRADAGFNTRWQQGGTQYFQGVAIGGSNPDVYNSSYSKGSTAAGTSATRFGASRPPRPVMRRSRRTIRSPTRR